MIIVIAAMGIFYLPSLLIFGKFVGALVYSVLLFLLTPFLVSYQVELFENFRRVKPDAAGAAEKNDGAFIKVAMAAGAVGALLLIILFCVAIALAPTVFVRLRAMNVDGNFGGSPYGYEYPGQQNGAPYGGQAGSAGMGANASGTLMLAPASGPVGTLVTISDPMGSFTGTNTIMMNGLVAANATPASDGTLSFQVPSSLRPNCSPGKACPQFILQVSPNSYDVTVNGPQGTVDAGVFEVVGGSTGAY
jgi:hypothetical protein